MGKSTAVGFLRDRGICVVDTDDLARQLVQPGQPALTEIQAQFGPSIISADGQLRRDELARLVFADPPARRKLEAILHPRIREAWLGQIQFWRQAGCQLAFVIIPLLFETSAESHFDKIVCVACSPAVQHQRLLARGWPATQIPQRIAAQWPVETKMAHSHFVVWTDGDLAVHGQQWERILSGL